MNRRMFPLNLPQFLRSLSFRGKGSPPPEIGTYSIEPICHDLRELSGVAEEKFLYIGERLFRFQKRTRKMSAMVSEVADIMGGKATLDAITGLESIVDRVMEFERISHENISTVDKLLRLLKGVSDKLQGFENTVKNLEMLGIYTKMENARLGDLGVEFKGLAQDIKTLCLEIQGKFQTIFAHTSEVEGLLMGARNSIGTVQQKRKGQANVITKDARSGIEELRERHHLSLSAVRKVETLSHEVARNMEEIVSSMQFQDITRQQMEHVIEALETLDRGHFFAAGENDGKHGDAAPKAIDDGVEVCELQLEQLRHSRNLLVSAVERILQSLVLVSESIDHMAREAGSMLQETESSYRVSLSETDEMLGSLTTTFSDYESMGKQLSGTLAEVAKTAGEMIGFIDNIREIENKVKLIALNSSIKAAHLGSDGAVFSVLADEIQRLVEELVDLSRVVTESLESMNASSQVLASTEADSRNAAVTSENGHRDLVAAIHRESERISVMMEEVNEESELLTGDIRNLVDDVTIHTDAGDVLDRTMEKIASVVSHNRSLLPESAVPRDKDRVQVLESRYTMESEREIHRAVTDSEFPGEEKTERSDPSEGVRKEAEKGGDDEFGDNVELF